MCHDMPLVQPPPLFQGGGGERSILGKKSKDKGARGERELAGILREYGYETRRGQQYCGANGDADVVGLPGIHIECKRVENLNIYEAMEQAINDSSANDLPYGYGKYDRPTVFHRKNKCEWLVTMRFDDFSDLYTSSGVGGFYFYQMLSERTFLYRWIVKATNEAKRFGYDFPAVSHRKGGPDWFVTVRLKDWITIYREWESGKALEQE